MIYATSDAIAGRDGSSRWQGRSGRMQHVRGVYQQFPVGDDVIYVPGN